MKNVFIHGLVAGILSGTASIVYNSIYTKALMVDYSKVIQSPALIGSCVLGCLLASLGFYFLTRFLNKSGQIIFNALFVVLCFASIAGPFAAHLPLDVKSPELFAGLTVPMHFFPPLMWFATLPLFKYSPLKS
jgi:hypothetical protein